jgi:hypothetical protein
VNAASPAEMLAAVERWAQMREWWDDGKPHRQGGTPWLVYLRSAGDVLLWERLPAYPPATEQLQAHYASPAVALAWAILVESEPLPVDVGLCPECVARGGAWEARTVRIMGPSIGSLLEDEGWERTSEPYDTGLGAIPWALDLRRPCPACSGSGRNLAAVPRLLLDATTDAAARDALLVYSDQLQAAGDPTGELLSWALVLWTGEQCQPGHLHTVEAVAWLDRLTLARQETIDEAEDERRLDEAFAREAARTGIRF